MSPDTGSGHGSFHQMTTKTGLDTLPAVLQRTWGYDRFLPLQKEAMGCVLEGRDSVVVLPTGGGKSLCFQTPALCMPGLAVVVSPLISLMKDQVDALRTCGVPAACINSTHSLIERRRVVDEIRAGRLKLLYVAPERLVMDRTISFLKTVQPAFIAVDEAHCISAWGHDFRPEYRELSILKEAFPGICVHAYTATATHHVRDDIARELRLTDPEVLVGSFDRPNLVYKVARCHDRLNQVREVVDRHRGESGIIYCISRAEVDRIAGALANLGYRVLPYHAGMADDDRRQNQEAFIQERVDIMVATVAFGMGIDKSNVRYVVHAGMPKSLESYQQESGRAGRDGLEGECCLFYSDRDFMLWKSLIARSEVESQEASLGMLSAMHDYATGVVCRRRILLDYFGETYAAASCRACDVCLGELELVEDALTIGQKILSCVVRLNQFFGGDYTAMVLHGSKDQRILGNRHDRLTTYGILSGENRRAIRDWIEQLVGQDYLRKEGEYNVLKLTAEGTRLLRGEVTPRLLKPKPPPKKKSAGRPAARVEADTWEGVDRGLFEVLRLLRREKAVTRSVPAYVVFSDATLRDMARRRPTTLEGFLEVHGVGHKRCEDHGEAFVHCMREYCSNHDVPMDQDPAVTTVEHE